LPNPVIDSIIVNKIFLYILQNYKKYLSVGQHALENVNNLLSACTFHE